MKRKPVWFVAGCLAVGSVSSGLLGVDESADKDAQKPTTQLQDRAAGDKAAASMQLIRAEDLLGRDVKNEEGKDIGEIKDIVVDSRQGRIAYAVMQFGGFLGLGEKQFAIPFRALSEDAARKNLILNVAKEKLEAARGFDDDQWPDMANETWARDTHKHYGVDNYWDDQGATPRSQDRQPGSDVKPDTKPDARLDTDAKRDGDARLSTDAQAQRPQLNREHFWLNRVSQIIGKPVKNNAGEDLGKIADLMVDMKHGRLVYAVITDGGTLGIGETLAAVPYSALTVQAEQKQFTLNTTKDALKATGFKEDAWPNMADVHWAQRTHKTFNQEPYWTAFGFAGDDLDANWRQDSDYNKAFTAGKSQSITGKVTSISLFAPGKDSPKGRQVVITDEAGKTFTVHLGPVAHLDRQTSLKLKEGDTVTIIAVPGKFEGLDVFQARQIRMQDGQTHELRDAQGRAKWDAKDDDRRQPDNDRDQQNQPTRPGQNPANPRN